MVALVPALAGATVHHDAEVRLSPAEHRLAVTDRVTLSDASAEAAVFTLHAGLTPTVTTPGAALERVAGESADDGAAPVEQWRVVLPAGSRTFELRYAGVIDHPVAETGAEYARSMATTPGLVSPEGVYLTGSSAWLPELAGGALVTFDLRVWVPPDWDAVSQGERREHERAATGTRVRWVASAPQEEVTLVAAAWVETDRQAGAVALEAFLRTPDPALATRYLDAAGGYLAMYDRLIGAYPYPKFAVVESFWETGYGLPSFTFLGPRILRFPFILHSSYPHEILHDWWGNGVYVDLRGGNWSEGLTAYLADHLVKEAQGQGADYRRTALQRWADYVAEKRDFPVTEFRSRHSASTQAVGYDKVLMIFHMLRGELGDVRFMAGLRRFWSERRFTRSSFDDLAGVLGREAGRDLRPFFTQWTTRTGAPELRLGDTSVREQGGRFVASVTVEQTPAGKPFALEVPVALTLEGVPEARVRRLRLDGARATLESTSVERPLRVDVDPELDVFRRLGPGEVPPSLSGAFGARRVVLVLPRAAPPELARALEGLARAWARGESTIEVAHDDAPLKSLAGAAVWVLGWDNRLLPEVARAVAPLGATLTTGAVRFAATTLGRADRSVALAGRRVDDPASTIAFLGADRAAAIAGLARKLPHYGKYGLLGFEGDEPVNVVKEVWSAESTVLSARLGGGPALAPRAALPRRAPLAEPPLGN
jgi:hypothetical protein